MLVCSYVSSIFLVGVFNEIWGFVVECCFLTCVLLLKMNFYIFSVILVRNWFGFVDNFF